MKKGIKITAIIFVFFALVYGGKYLYDIHLNYNFDTITANKVYKSGVIPPDKIKQYVEKYKIKSIIDLRMPGTNDLVLNPEIPGELQLEREAVSKIKGVNYFNNPSEQIPNQKNIAKFKLIMDNPKNYPVLIHCHHGTGRAILYSAIYRIEYENFTNEQARLDTRGLVKFSSFDNGTPKGEYLKSYVSIKK